VQTSCVMEGRSRNWRRKLEKPVCQWWTGEFEQRYSKLVGGSRPESLPGWHISDTGEV